MGWALTLAVGLVWDVTVGPCSECLVLSLVSWQFCEQGTQGIEAHGFPRLILFAFLAPCELSRLGFLLKRKGSSWLERWGPQPSEDPHLTAFLCPGQPHPQSQLWASWAQALSGWQDYKEPF